MIGRVGSNPPILQSTSSKNICSEQFLLMPQWHEGYSAISSGCCFQSLGGFRRLVIHREWAANQRSQNFHGFEVVHIDMLSFVTILQQMELCSKSVPFLFCNTDRVRAASRHRSVVHVGDMEQWRSLHALLTSCMQCHIRTFMIKGDAGSPCGRPVLVTNASGSEQPSKMIHLDMFIHWLKTRFSHNCIHSGTDCWSARSMSPKSIVSKAWRNLMTLHGATCAPGDLKLQLKFPDHDCRGFPPQSLMGRACWSNLQCNQFGSMSMTTLSKG